MGQISGTEKVQRQMSGGRNVGEGKIMSGEKMCLTRKNTSGLSPQDECEMLFWSGLDIRYSLRKHNPLSNTTPMPQPMRFIVYIMSCVQVTFHHVYL